MVRPEFKGICSQVLRSQSTSTAVYTGLRLQTQLGHAVATSDGNVHSPLAPPLSSFLGHSKFDANLESALVGIWRTQGAPMINLCDLPVDQTIGVLLISLSYLYEYSSKIVVTSPSPLTMVTLDNGHSRQRSPLTTKTQTALNPSSEDLESLREAVIRTKPFKSPSCESGKFRFVRCCFKLSGMSSSSQWSANEKFGVNS